MALNTRAKMAKIYIDNDLSRVELQRKAGIVMHRRILDKIRCANRFTNINVCKD